MTHQLLQQPLRGVLLILLVQVLYYTNIRTFKKVMWYFEDGGTFLVLRRGWCDTLKMAVWYFEEGLDGTLKRVV